MKSWYDIYKDRMNDRYLKKVKTKYRPFLERIKDASCYHYLELGCGAGFITRSLREYSRYSQFTLVDNCPKMLSLAMENNPDEKCIFMCADITKHHPIPNCDDHTVIHSHGVLEHFQDEDIINTLNMADNYGPFQVHFVPGEKYEIPSRGDERLMSVDKWNSILKQVPRHIKFDISTFNNGYDYLISIWRDGLKEF